MISADTLELDRFSPEDVTRDAGTVDGAVVPAAAALAICVLEVDLYWFRPC